MPTRIKIILSLIISVAAIGGYFFQDYLGQVGPKYAALVVGLLMVVGMWIFPEVTGKKTTK
jgi:membrane protein YdbS with pleckstrin-like domain